ncbi:MAG: AAA+ family ATPase, partial [Candidatus Latescibacteria bacterium]|nr:AAA+ family ATPase [Candidatus Latescibacterota bacterium]
RYWFATQPTVTRLADDRASQFHEHDVQDEIHRRLRNEARSRGDFRRIHACVRCGDIPDDKEARLVLLGCEHPHAKGEEESPALEEAANILSHRGNAPRQYKNTLVFLAGDKSRLDDLSHAARQYLAWKSIILEREELNLDPHQVKQAETKYRHAEDTLTARIPETWNWLIVPDQPDPRGSMVWSVSRLQGSGDSLAARVSKKLLSEEFLITQMAGVRLRLELDRVPLWRGNDVGVGQLVEDFATYLYLPRLRDSDVLLAAIRDGVAALRWEEETFALAQGKDEESGRYLTLKAGKAPGVLSEHDSLIVKPDVAMAQIEKDRKEKEVEKGEEKGGEKPEIPGTGEGGEPPDDTGDNGGDDTSPKPQLHRFHGSVQLNPIRVGRDASQIAEEVIQHLSKLVGAEVEVTLEIHAKLRDGASEKTVRDVTENCRTLKFETYGFEEE